MLMPTPVLIIVLYELFKIWPFYVSFSVMLAEILQNQKMLSSVPHVHEEAAVLFSRHFLVESCFID